MLLRQQQQQGKKRKDVDFEGEERRTRTEGPPKRARPNTSVFVSGLPLDASVNEIADVFARYGVLLEDDAGHPRVKMYQDAETQTFRGEALVVYYKPESVELAIQLLDDTHLRAAKGEQSGPKMHVERASFQDTPKQEGNESSRAPLTEADKKSIRRRMNRMQKYAIVTINSQQSERLGLGLGVGAPECGSKCICSHGYS